MEVRSLIGGTATTCDPEVSLADAARLMLDQQIGSLGVMSDGRFIAILTDRDLVRAVAEGPEGVDTTVETWMTPDPDSVAPDTEVSAAVEWLLATGYRHLPVVEDDDLLGIVSIKDLLWALDPVWGSGDG